MSFFSIVAWMFRVHLAEWLRTLAELIDPRGILLAEVLPVRPEARQPSRRVRVPVAEPWSPPPTGLGN